MNGFLNALPSGEHCLCVLNFLKTSFFSVVLIVLQFLDYELTRSIRNLKKMLEFVMLSEERDIPR
jgi:hypothetical protein